MLYGQKCHNQLWRVGGVALHLGWVQFWICVCRFESVISPTWHKLRCDRTNVAEGHIVQHSTHVAAAVALCMKRRRRSATRLYAIVRRPHRAQRPTTTRQRTSPGTAIDETFVQSTSAVYGRTDLLTQHADPTDCLHARLISVRWLYCRAQMMTVAAERSNQ